MPTICVVGTGYVGLTTAVCLADLGNLVAMRARGFIYRSVGR